SHQEASAVSTQDIFGWTWSENIGWVSFNNSQLAGCPSGTCEARLNLTSGQVSGWARACSGTVNGDCTGATRTDGWDGWISLAGTGYAVSMLGGASSYAWGSDVVGWINFNSNSSSCTSTAPVCSVDHQSSSYTNSACNLITTQCAPYLCTDTTGACITAPPPSGCFSVGVACPGKKTATIRKGTTTTLYWNIADVASCTVSGSNGEGGSGAGASWNATSQTTGVVTSAIQQKTVYTLTCIGNDASTFIDTVTVSLIPVFQEI
ncbi:MAG: Uncharacterized protein G01um101456_188, partial [Parcubacteria group bacterium Gr01-1014_56]